MSSGEAGDTSLQDTHPGEEIHSHDQPSSTEMDEQSEDGQLSGV